MRPKGACVTDESNFQVQQPASTVSQVTTEVCPDKGSEERLGQGPFDVIVRPWQDVRNLICHRGQRPWAYATAVTVWCVWVAQVFHLVTMDGR